MKPLAFKYGKGKPPAAQRAAVQPKMSVNKPGDRFEREADEMARKVIEQGDTSMIAKSIRKPPDVTNKSTKDKLMRKAESPSGYSSVVGVPGMTSSPGSPMPGSVRTFMEDAFSRDFSAVRLHTDPEAAQMSQKIGARAFTHGSDIYFNTGQYLPGTPEGKKLLAHELTHVVQQNEISGVPELQRAIELVPPGPNQASAFGRVQELIDRLNAQSPAIQYNLEGNLLRFNIVDPASMTNFDTRMSQFIGLAAVVRVRLITSEGMIRGGPDAGFEGVVMDDFDSGYLDLDDLLATDDLSFQTNLLHILAERFSPSDYTRRIGTRFSDAEFNRAHAAGLEEEAANFRAIFHDSSIRVIGERRGRNSMVVFRSVAEHYRIYIIFYGTNGPDLRIETRVRTPDGRWFSGEEFRQQRAAVGGDVVQPKLFVNKAGDPNEYEADAIAEQVVHHRRSEIVKRPLKKRQGSQATPAPSSVISALKNSKGTGTQIPDAVKVYMENAFGRDFSSVRIHTDARAAGMSRDVQAKAFTHGGDIYFNSGQFAPGTADGKELLAHELVHVVQQNGNGHPENTIQRIAMEATPELPEADKYFEGVNGIIDVRSAMLVGGKKRKGMRMKLNEVKVASQKFEEVSDYSTIPIRFKDRPSNQAILWRKEKPNVSQKVISKIKEKGKTASKKENDVEYFFFKLKKSYQQYVIGTLDQIVDAMIIPSWNKAGEMRKFHVDHRKEWQFGGKHEPSNFWLWQDTANMSAGSLLDKEIVRRIQALIEEAIDADKIWKVPKKKKEKNFISDTAEKVKNDFEITVVKIIPGLGPIKGKPDEHFNMPEIFEQGLPLEGLKPMTEREIDNLSGSKTELSIMLGNRAARKPRRVSNRLNKLIENWVKGLSLLEVTDYNPDAVAGEQYAVLEGYLFKKQEKKNLIKISGVRIPVVKVPGVPFFGKVESRISEYILNRIEIPDMSLIQMEEAYIDDESEAVVLAGKVIPGLSFLKNADIDILYDGEDVSLSKTFDIDGLQGNVPRPFDLTDGQITVSVSLANGLGVSGRLDFAIENAGSGYIEGGGSKKGFVLKGAFDFDKGLFDESHIEVSYQKTAEEESGKFSFKGWAAKKATKDNTAIKAARIEVSYENKILDAKGEAETSLAAIPKGSIRIVTGGPKTSVEADFIIGDVIPGVSGGNLHFLFEKMQDDTYQIAAAAAIQTKFPGIPRVELSGIYKSDGTFLFEGTAILNKGRFNGNIHFGITNQEVDENGQLTGKKGDKLIAFGDGEVNLQLNKWLGGKIVARITPDARVILGGELKPEPLLPITKDPYTVDKPLGGFELPKFTLFGIPGIAQIYVTAGGSISFFASLGPVYLKGAFVKCENLDIEHPESTIMTGGGSLDIPAEASVTLSAFIKAGAGILVVDVSFRLDGSISFVVKANAGLSIQFEYSMNKGLTLKESTASLNAKAELVAKLTGRLSVDLDLLLGSINLYEQDWKFGEKRWPIGPEIELKFPLGFEGGDGENFKFPNKDEVKNSEPKFEQDTIKQAAIGEDPSVSAAPGKEETLYRVRTLPADATVEFESFLSIWERYSYVKGLKKKHPEVDWNYLTPVLVELDAKELRGLREDIFEVQGIAGLSATKLRLMMLHKFDEEHLYVGPDDLAELREQIFQAERRGSEV